MNLSASDLAQGYRMGIGAVYQMNAVGTPGTNYNGTSIQESVYPVIGQNSCPASIGNPCNAGTSLTVGNSGNFGLETPEDAALNVMWDQHADLFTSSPLPTLLGAGQYGTCSAFCSQTYFCGGQQVGTFTIEYDFSAQTIYGTPVTTVSVGKY